MREQKARRFSSLVVLFYPSDWLQTASRIRPLWCYRDTWPLLRCWSGSEDPSQLGWEKEHKTQVISLLSWIRIFFLEHLCKRACTSPTVVDVLGKLADGFGVGQIQLLADDLGPLHLPHDVAGRLLPPCHVSACQNHPRPCGIHTTHYSVCVCVSSWFGVEFVSQPILSLAQEWSTNTLWLC